jgi:hypothetical protein
MNKAQARQIILICVLAILGYLFYSHQRTQNIIKVYDQRGQSARDSTVINQFRVHGEIVNKRSFNFPKFVDKIQNIDTSHCPKRFQMAWLEYVQACQRVAKEKPGSDTMLYLLGIITRTHTFDNLPEKDRETGDDMEKATQLVDRVATEYNVRIVYKPI